MKNVKSFLAKNFLVFAFAVGGIFAVTSNVTVSGNNPPETGIGVEVTCYGRGVHGSIGYYYCDGLSQCYWVSNANADTHTGARKCTLTL